MNKDGKIRLTEEDYVLFQQGQLPTGIKSQWGIEKYQELKEMIDSGQWELIKNNELTLLANN